MDRQHMVIHAVLGTNWGKHRRGQKRKQEQSKGDGRAQHQTVTSTKPPSEVASAPNTSNAVTMRSSQSYARQS